MGLAYRCVPADQLQEEARAIARRLAAGPTRSLGLSKQLLNRTFETYLAAALDGDEQDERLRATAGFTELLYEHVCEGMYGAPEYGGNRDLVGWRSIGFEGDVQPRGYTDDEVSLP